MPTLSLALEPGSVVVQGAVGGVTTLFRYSAGDSLASATFSRPSTATYRDSNGVLQTAASGVARDSHYALDPVSGLYVRTLLLEAQRTNLVRYSEDLSNAAWTKTASAVNSVSAGVSNVTINAGAPGIFRASAVAASTTHAASTIVRGVEGQQVHFGFNIGSNDGYQTITFTGDWQEVRQTNATDGSGNTNIHFRCDAIYGGMPILGTVTFDVRFVQLEAGAFPSSYIPTGASAVTRAADSLSAWGPTWASQETTQYERYYPLSTRVLTTSVSIATRTTPTAPTNDRAYRDVIVLPGSKVEADFAPYLS